MAVKGRTVPDIFRDFPGIVAASTSGEAGEGSRVHTEDDRVVAAFVFTPDVYGRTARLVVTAIFSRLGKGDRLDSRAPVREDPKLASGHKVENAAYFGCSKRQWRVFERALAYASARPIGGPHPSTELTDAPLSFLLSHAFSAFERDYAAAIGGDAAQPSMALWSNFLRVIDDDGVPSRDLPSRAVLSRRGQRAVLRDLQRLGWVRVAKDRRTNHLHLTDAGGQARATGARVVAAVEKEWHARFATARLDALRESLIALVSQFEIELPWCMTGYGPGDVSATGGNFVAAQEGPPRLPHHGEDWPLVLRQSKDVDALPLPALLSQALTMFTIDYEWAMRGYGAGLYLTTTLLRFIDDDGMALEQARAMGDVTGNGKSGTERHFVTVVEPGSPRDGSRKVYLTPKGKRARDSFSYLVQAGERDWAERYGACAAQLREALAALDADFGPNLPDYPNTSKWFWHSMLAGSAVVRSGKR